VRRFSSRKNGTMYFTCSVARSELAKNEIEVAAVDPIASMMKSYENQFGRYQLKLKNSNGPLPLCIRIF
jgi:hypothetical protein